MFPHIPKDFHLSIQRKYYLHLAFQLCDREPLCRLNSIEKTELALAGIQRKLEYGITGKDLFCDTAKKLKYWALRALAASWKMTRLYWYFVFLFILVGGGTAYWIKKPDPPTDMSKMKTKLFRSQHFDLSMTIPAQWETMPKDMIKQEMERGSDLNKEIDRKRLETADAFMKAGIDWLCIDFKDQPEGIIIQYVSNPPINPLAISHDRLRILMKQSMQQMWNREPAIYEMKTVIVAGHKAVYTDYSGFTGYRGAAYYFYQNNKLIMITLSCKVESFLKNKKDFEAAVATLKFHK